MALASIDSTETMIKADLYDQTHLTCIILTHRTDHNEPNPAILQRLCQIAAVLTRTGVTKHLLIVLTQPIFWPHPSPKDSDGDQRR